jgi:acyl carrier protein
MSLPVAVIEFLNQSAIANGSDKPEATADLFATGTLDSFALVDFITVLEEHCEVRIPDNEVIPANFRTIEAIENYIELSRS